MSRSYTRRLSSLYSKKISTSRKISTLTDNPLGNGINCGQNKRSVLNNNTKATCEENN